MIFSFVRDHIKRIENMPKFYCDYCDIYLAHSSIGGRRQHAIGRKHIQNKVEYYQRTIREMGVPMMGMPPPPFPGGMMPPPPGAPGGMFPPPPPGFLPHMLPPPPFPPGFVPPGMAPNR